jgi:hypothetical protein
VKSYIKSLPTSAVQTAFNVVYAITLLMALFPPLYLAASGSRTNVLGMPFAIFYWIADAAVIGLAVWARYVVEDLRGELDDEVVPTPAPAVARTDGSPS